MTMRTHAQARAQVREGTGPGEHSRAGNPAHDASPADPRGGARRPVRFPLGRLLATPGALRACDEAGANPAHYLARHASGDWGDLSAEDRAANDRALLTGDRLLSAYRLPNGERIWVITEADRSATTALLPQEY